MKGKSWEELYGVEGARRRREQLKQRNKNRKGIKYKVK